jgi:hypothetical protein
VEAASRRLIVPSRNQKPFESKTAFCNCDLCRRYWIGFAESVAGHLCSDRVFYKKRRDAASTFRSVVSDLVGLFDADEAIAIGIQLAEDVWRSWKFAWRECTV